MNLLPGFRTEFNMVLLYRKIALIPLSSWKIRFKMLTQVHLRCSSLQNASLRVVFDVSFSLNFWRKLKTSSVSSAFET